jgi:hypothetical protein
MRSHRIAKPYTLNHITWPTLFSTTVMSLGGRCSTWSCDSCPIFPLAPMLNPISQLPTYPSVFPLCPHAMTISSVPRPSALIWSCSFTLAKLNALQLLERCVHELSYYAKFSCMPCSHATSHLRHQRWPYCLHTNPIIFGHSSTL